MAEIKYKAPNGQILIARDEVQAKAFEKEGLERVETKK